MIDLPFFSTKLNRSLLSFYFISLKFLWHESHFFNVFHKTVLFYFIKYSSWTISRTFCWRRFRFMSKISQKFRNDKIQTSPNQNWKYPMDAENDLIGQKLGTGSTVRLHRWKDFSKFYNFCIKHFFVFWYYYSR